MIKTASVLISREEVSWLSSGRNIIYRPISLHWDGQLRKFLEPRTRTLEGTEIPYVVHLITEFEKTGGGTFKRNYESRVLVDISEEAEFPVRFPLEVDHLRGGDKCWALVLGEKVEA